MSITIDESKAAPIREKNEDRAYIRAHPQIKTLINRRPQGIESYIESNVTDLASAKDILKLLAVTISILSGRIVDK